MQNNIFSLTYEHPTYETIKQCKLAIPHIVVSAEVCTPNLIATFCCLQFYKNYADISIVSPRMVCDFLGITSDVRKSHVEKINTIFEFMYDNEIILEPARFQDNRSAIVIYVNPKFFTCKFNKQDANFFRLINMEDYLILYRESLYGSAKKYGLRTMLAHYMVIQFMIYQHNIVKKRIQRQPDYAYISQIEIADILNYDSSSTTSEVCRILKELKLIYFDKPMSAVQKGVFHRYKTIFVNMKSTIDENYCWQQEYCNAFYHQFKKQLSNMTTDERTYVTSQLPPEVKEYIDMKKMAADTPANIPDEELF